FPLTPHSSLYLYTTPNGLTPFFYVFFFNATATTEIYTVGNTLSLHDALPISCCRGRASARGARPARRAPPARSEEHTSELQSLPTISYAVFCLKKKKMTW